MTEETTPPAKPKRTFRMLQPTKDAIRAELAAEREKNAQLTAEVAWLKRPWWQRLFSRR